MNYRHAFHAGNFADVFKHVLLIALLDALKAKPTAFCYVDTHAGAGCYDLRAEPAQKTGEYADGVQRVFAAAEPALQPYIELLRSWNPDGPLALYPGSPLIAARLLRAQDRAVLCELQDDEYTQLKALFAADPRVGVHRRDGYAALAALLPPKERRGLVLIDPPFEAQEDEFRAIEAALTAAHARWPTGIYAIWYPIKQHTTVLPFLRWATRSGLRKVLIAELLLQPDNSPLRLNGCGMLIANAPWKLDATLREVLPALQRTLAPRSGTQRLQWLVRD